MFDSKVFAANLRALRARARLKQEDVAKATGLDTSTISKYESGTGNGPSYQTAWDIADLFGVSLDDLGGRVMRYDDPQLLGRQ